MIINPSSGSGTIPDGSILNIKIANGTISSAKLDASLNALINAGGGGGSVAEGSITSFHIATGSILGTDISHNTITYDNIAHNAVTNTKIADNSITHAKLTSNCVQSHNIVDGTILGTDICGNTITGSNIAIGTITSSNIADGTILGTDISFGQIGEAHLDASFNTILGEVGDAIKELSRLQGVITIKNTTSYDQSFSYKLFYKNSITLVEDATEFVGYTDLNYTTSASHFFKLPSALHLITLKVLSPASLEGYNVSYGGEDNLTGDGNNQDFLITDVNVLIECEVAI